MRKSTSFLILYSSELLGLSGKELWLLAFRACFITRHTDGHGQGGDKWRWCAVEAQLIATHHSFPLLA